MFKLSITRTADIIKYLLGTSPALRPCLGAQANRKRTLNDANGLGACL